MEKNNPQVAQWMVGLGDLKAVNMFRYETHSKRLAERIAISFEGSDAVKELEAWEAE